MVDQQGSFFPEPEPADTAAMAQHIGDTARAQHLAEELKAKGVDPDLEGIEIARAALTAEPEAPANTDEGRPDLTAHEEAIGRIPTSKEFQQIQDEASHERFDDLRAAAKPASSEDSDSAAS